MPDTVIKQLKKPWKVGGQESTEIEVRPSTVDDTCEAEAHCSPARPNGFMVEMACRQVLRCGTFAGPFAPAHFKSMKSPKFDEICQAMREADQLGED